MYILPFWMFYSKWFTEKGLQQYGKQFNNLLHCLLNPTAISQCTEQCSKPFLRQYNLYHEYNFKTTEASYIDSFHYLRSYFMKVSAMWHQ